jgi:quinol-cytochrome oxidoreductase complex cytochrome b subunit
MARFMYNMKYLKCQSILSIVNSYTIDSPTASNISYIWNLGSILGLILVLQILTGVTLGFHYCADISMAFDSIEHIHRDVQYGALIRYAHANGAAFFFIIVYAHIAKSMYYSSYVRPRQSV